MFRPSGQIAACLDSSLADENTVAERGARICGKCYLTSKGGSFSTFPAIAFHALVRGSLYRGTLFKNNLGFHSP